MTERLEEIDKRLKEIEEIQKPLWKEYHMLEDEKDKIFTSLAFEIAKNLAWKLDYNKDNYSCIRLSYVDSKEKDEANEKLWKCGGGYHHTYQLDDGSELMMDDGDLSMVFETPSHFKKYLKKWNLKVDTLEFRKRLDGYKNDLKILEQIVEMEERVVFT